MLPKVSVAPMLKVSHRHWRYLIRLLAPEVTLYTEMLVARALVEGDPARLLAHDGAEHPLVLQLAGSDPQTMGRAARLAEPFGFAALNLNAGCPSRRAGDGEFGACLFARPERVAACVAEMRANTDLPVSVKTRIGLDDLDDDEALMRFVDIVHPAGCGEFILHARKAWLNGLSPKQNRRVPPLDYPRVHRLKRAFPELTIVLNGGIDDAAMMRAQLECVDGVMLGRAVRRAPAIARVMQRVQNPGVEPPGWAQVVEGYLAYIERRRLLGDSLRRLLPPLLGLAHARPGAAGWRRELADCMGMPEAAGLIRAARLLEGGAFGGPSPVAV